MIRVEGLSVETRKNNKTSLILNKINLNIPKGKISILTGESGTGKTVLAKTISGLLNENLLIRAGTFYLNNSEVTYTDIRKLTGKGVFYAPQNARASLNPVLRIKTQFKDIKGFSSDQILALMKNLEFDEPERVLNSYPFELSEGECQRIIFTMGVLLGPQLFILDEPTTALDVDTQKTLIDHIIRINRRDNVTVLLITHNLLLLKIKDENGNPVQVYHHRL